MKNKPKNKTMMGMGPSEIVKRKQSDILENPGLSKMSFWWLAAVSLLYRKDVFLQKKTSF